MALGKDYAGQNCSIARALEVVGERWTLLIIRDAFFGVRRFSDFLAHLDCPRAVLSGRLQTLVESGVLTKRLGEYTLTESGRELWPIVYMLGQWGGRHFSADGPTRVLVHAECGTPIDPAGDCPPCGVPGVPPTDLEVHTVPGRDLRDDPVARALRSPHRLLEPLPVRP
ncbi:transcriptional regulator [Actinomadura craniellae]|uniref:Transcriptional regulator n=1 Tax=Actinomadura craniellae TaxID=2231787 RepID=A0A365GZJ4_9ACTN|nr:helix-turn-helix domain-containing protein [Actinomadura craniellae]RAY12259.1 transcriptional regulator [Actinomadura craniellae]